MRMKSLLLKGILGIILLFAHCAVKAQEQRVVYILADRQQPFYVRTAEKVYSSSSLGYLIMSVPKQNKTSFTIGYPKNKWKSGKYSIEIAENDIFLLLKQVDSSTWGLYDKHSNQVIIPDEVVQPIKTDTSKDPFSVMLAEVSDNPSILQQKKRELSVDTVKISEVKQDEASNQQMKNARNDSAHQVVHVETVKQKDGEAKKQQIERTMYFIDSTGVSMGYELSEGDKKEKIVVFIPADAKDDEATQKPNQVKKKRKKQPEEKADDSRLTDLSIDKNVREQQTKETKKIRCQSIANDTDFRLLRRNMALEEDEENMLIVADTGIANQGKCYTSEQLKNLAVLFLNDRLRFLFVETALGYLSDSGDAKLLENLFRDEENRRKFRAAIEKKRP